MENHNRFMSEAIKEAKKAFEKDEVPIGAIVVYDDKIIARAHNLTENLCDPTAHAEMQAITAAASHMGGKYLDQCTLYVTLEPCPMCAGALYWSQLGTLIYGAEDPKRGYTNLNPKLLHPRTKVIKNILSDDSAGLINLFFKKRR
ncbi:MAG: nucleoside deaminase [Bacteroidales bacterium]